MPRNECKQFIADLKNGVVTPIYFDKQVVRASDLMLGRESHEAALARMRRLMHGWGIVSGFVPTVENDTVQLTAGYAVAPSGAEIFMPEGLVLKDIAKCIEETCGPKKPDCDTVTKTARAQAKIEMALAGDRIGAWLIARPASNETEPRPGIPEGCAHPANVLLPTRRCHMVQLELICTLPGDKVIIPPNCADINPYICGSPKTGRTAPYPYPGAPGQVDDYIVIGYLFLDRRANALTAILHHRRVVLPTSVLQDWIQSCLCPIEHSLLTEDPSEGDDPQPPTRPKPGGKWGDYYHNGEILNGGFLPGDLIAAGAGETSGDVRPDNGLINPVHRLYRERERVKKFETLGIDGPENFLEMDLETLVVATGLSGGDILKMKEELIATADWWTVETTTLPLSKNWTTFSAELFDAGVSTNWHETNAPTESKLPLLTAVVASPAELKEKGLNGPADILAKSDTELATILDVSKAEASAIKTDMMRFVPLMATRI